MGILRIQPFVLCLFYFWAETSVKLPVTGKAEAEKPTVKNDIKKSLKAVQKRTWLGK